MATFILNLGLHVFKYVHMYTCHEDTLKSALPHAKFVFCSVPLLNQEGQVHLFCGTAEVLLYNCTRQSETFVSVQNAANFNKINLSRLLAGAVKLSTLSLVIMMHMHGW